MKVGEFTKLHRKSGGMGHSQFRALLSARGWCALTVSPQGPASFDDPDLVIQAALDGVGLGTAMEETLTGLIAEGRLIQVLRDWCPAFPGYFLYYPSRRNQPAALAALIDTLRLS